MVLEQIVHHCQLSWYLKQSDLSLKIKNTHLCDEYELPTDI